MWGFRASAGSARFSFADAEDAPFASRDPFSRPLRLPVFAGLLGTPLRSRMAPRAAGAFRPASFKTGGCAMTTYIVQGRYSTEAIKGMMAKTEDRTAAVAKLFGAAGGKLISYYLTFGEYDFLCVTEAPSEQAALTGLIVAAAGGGVTHLKTTVAMSSGEAKKAFESAGKAAASYRAPGQG